MKGFDCASVLTQQTARMFAQQGFTHCCRYLVPVGWKRLTKREVDDITAAGLKIISVFETTANRPLGGALNGSLDGQQALQSALLVGQTKGSVIYFAVDFEAQLDQMGVIQEYIQEYIQAAAAQIKGYEIGVYGSYAVIEAMRVLGIKYLWQTRAWSKGMVSPSANIYQSDCGPDGQGLPMNGINVDLDVINDNVGGWDANMIPVVDANKIIANLSAYHATLTDKVKKDEVHNNANYLRVLSGQTPT